MESPVQSRKILRFGAFEVDLSAKEIRKSGMRLRLQGQPLQILLLLLASPGQVVSRDLIREQLWAADTFVDFEHSLNTAIKKLRQTLGDDADNARFVETLPRRGYRFIAPVTVDFREPVHDTESGKTAVSFGVTQASRWPQAKTITMFVALAAVLAVLIVGGRAYFGGVSDRIDSIAVLPLVNGSGDPNVEYLSDGLTESLINTLSELPHITVMSRSSVLRYGGQHTDPQAAGRGLKVQAVLTGRVVQHGDDLSISVELLRVDNNSHIWGGEFNRKVSDILAIQDVLSRDISDKLRRKLTGEEEKRLAKRSTTNPEAYRRYLKGRYFTEKFTKDGVNKGIQYFRQAIDLDPNYALAYDGLAFAYSDGEDDFFLSPRDSIPEATGAAKKALELDDTLSEAHLEMGKVHYWYDYDWNAAEKELRRAIELGPNYASAHAYYGWYLVSVGRFQEGIEESKRAQELDPLSIQTNAIAAQNFYFAHRYEEAIDLFGKTLEMDPNYWFAHMFLGLSYEASGDLPRATAECQRAREIETTIPWPPAVLAHAYAASGRKREAEQILKQLKDRSRQSYVPAYNLAEIYIGLGDKEQALALLEKAYADRSMLLTFLKVDPEFDSLHSDRRFKDLLRRIGLPQ
jgi:TolB-like protein/DNA-binding winged helix-turn-helix (wHTH) protein/Flp pilus assembly protein TadD